MDLKLFYGLLMLFYNLVGVVLRQAMGVVDSGEIISAPCMPILLGVVIVLRQLDAHSRG